ncbi:zinc finger protein 462-like isoform X2 [Xyrichtys novacula]|uniref:Zinc finger protein 462-like isoform X2 n=1 Tax=Xyrichtys novacula TaxID=13765 RepID=A0AAV1G872_XYRNO|nr:zinc finger protein 462-like isoform X2 [Xyrichtys novacula]
MQKDSVHIPTSGPMIPSQAVAQKSPTKCLPCGHCSLIFKSKVFLFEHLNKVHRFDVGAALTDAGLKHSETHKTVTDDSNYFECKNCKFKAVSLDDSQEHERQCQQKVVKKNGIQSNIISENHQAKIVVVLKKNEEISSVGPVKSSPKVTCTLSSSKDRKTYKRPLQTITKFLVPSAPTQLDDSSMSLLGTKETLILQESPSNSRPNSSGVFKVTAMPNIDMTTRDSSRCLLMDSFPDATSKQPKPQEQSGETPPNSVDKRPSNESSDGPPLKKAKKEHPKKANEGKQQPSSNPRLSLEFSEEEEEERKSEGKMGSSKVCVCKHCNFSAVGIGPISTHYQNYHPHVRFNAVYLQDPTDQSATFRCLKCPIEFSNVVKLKTHYTESHPETPDVLTMQTHELNLVFRCFVCPFTTDESKALKEHYKNKHPTHTVDNFLMYCRYLASKSPEGNESQLNTCGKVPSMEPPRKIPPVSTASKDAQKTPLSQPPTSMEADVAMYHCKNCTFAHKSVIVMHVHYQRSHPDEAVSIDTLKQSAHGASLTKSQTTSDKSPNHENVKSLPTEGNLDSQKSGIKDGPSKKRIKLILRNPMHIPKVVNSYLESHTAMTVEHEEDRSKRKKSPVDILSSSPPNKLFHCPRCSYSSTNITNVVGHHNTKHYGHEPTDTEEVASYSVEMEQRKSQMQVGTETEPSDSSRNEYKLKEDKVKEASVKKPNPFACPENLFYCQKCNFGSLTVKGVLNHQSKVHKLLKIDREHVIHYTALIRDQIEKSKSSENGFTAQLPLPNISNSKNNLFFCHFCNYSAISLDRVIRHYIGRHPSNKVKREQIRLYSSRILKKIGNSHLRKKEDKKKKAKVHLKVSESSLRAPQIQRIIQCHKCSYKTQHVYLLKRHMWQIHKVNRTVTEVLRMCYEQGTIKAGYHCETCVFSHETAEAVFDHCKKEHPKPHTLEYVVTRLHVGPTSTKNKRKKLQIKKADCPSEGNGMVEGLSSQSPGHSDTKMHSCKACSFKSDSLINLTHHYRAVHPWSVKEDGSVLDVMHSRKSSVSSQFEDQSNKHVTLHSYQEPLEFEDFSDSPEKVTKSSKKTKCHHCNARFPDQHNLHIHLRLEHPDHAQMSVSEPEKKQTQSCVHVFKCLYCTYVNTNHHGVLTHCQMRHPNLRSEAGSLYIDGDHLSNMKGCLKKTGQGLRVSGYMCNTCPQMCATLEKLNKHHSKNHDETKSTPPPELSTGPQKTQVKIRSNHGFISKASVLRKKMYTLVKCPHCNYKATTKIGLHRHILLYHSQATGAGSVDPVYKCVLCSSSYSRKKHLGSHYKTKHGKESYRKYFLPLKELAEKKPWPSSQDVLLSQYYGNSSEESVSNPETGENKMLVLLCPCCPYVNATHHGVLTHCQMMHPDFVARADELKAVEILPTNVVGFSKGGRVARGFRCKKCSQIYASVKKLKTHWERDHNRTAERATELSIKDTEEKQQDHEFQHSVLEAFALKNDPPADSGPGTDLTHQMETPMMDQQTTTPEKNKEWLYECHICTYKAFFRRYLQSHYRKFHKMDVLTTFNILEKYNKRKTISPQSGGSEAVKCKMCPDLMFDSPELLLDHFRIAHNSNQVLDFIILSRRSKRTTGLYKCIHCSKQLNGIRKMVHHLDRHRDNEIAKRKAMDVKDKETETSDVVPKDKPVEQAEVPMLETVEELSKWNVTPVVTLALPTSPLKSPAKPAHPEEDSVDDIPTCKLCGRTFMSLRGLRSHERSHEALAAIRKHTLPYSFPKHKVNKYIIYKPDTTKPFVCSFCSYRTNVMGLWRRHFMKNHHDVLTDPTAADQDLEEDSAQSDTEPPNLSEERIIFPEHHEKPETHKRSLYSEPPDVQRQLTQYDMLAQGGASSQAAVKETMMLESSVLYCDLCNFNTEHQSSLRRHYHNRHGKKMLRCKDCSFFTGSRKRLEMHMEMGHFSHHSEPTHQKHLSCPFCLYQTKNKNSMIDHIILHREERLVPIEVRRPKLSRYLQGIVFRCHKCTYTCGSPENLRLHMMKHDDIKPYKCRLCFFDCTRLSDLEAHLSDKHQVVRNHELVGQVCLNQLEARVGQMSKYEEEPSSDSEQLNVDTEIVKKEAMVSGYDEVQEETQTEHLPGNILIKLEETYHKQIEDSTNRAEEEPGSPPLDPQNENFKLSTSGQEELEQDQHEQAGTGLLSDPVQGQGAENVEDQNMCESMEFQSCNPSVKQQTEEDEAQAQLTEAEDSCPRVTHKKEEAEDGVSISEIAEKERANKLHVKLDVKDSIPEINEKMDQDLEGLMGHNIVKILNEESSITAANNPESVVSMVEEKSPESKFKVQCEIDALTLMPNCAQLKISHVESSGVSMTTSQKDLLDKQQNSEEIRDPYGEMPVLKNEYLNEERNPRGCYEDSNQSDHLEEKQDKKHNTSEGDEDGCTDQEHEEVDGTKDANKPHELEGALQVTEEDNEEHCRVSTEDKQFTCELCGRNLMNSSDLQRHVVRHGL